MFCSKCGSEVKDGVNFCPKCGAQLSTKGKREVQGKSLQWVM